MSVGFSKGEIMLHELKELKDFTKNIKPVMAKVKEGKELNYEDRKMILEFYREVKLICID